MNNDKWVYVTKRLPDSSGYYEASCEELNANGRKVRFVRNARYDADKGHWYNCRHCHVYAWRPLEPAPPEARRE